MKKPSEILIGARELLASPAQWVKGYYAFNKSRDMREVGDDDATCFCMIGALAKSAGSFTGVGGYEQSDHPEIDYLAKVVGEHVPNYNDHPERTHDEVIAAFDKAIQLAQADGQ